jgi:ribonuclease HII
MSSTEIGKSAELAAAHYLKTQGYNIVQNNWRTRWCEIDIIAKKNKVVYFIEVKYRKNTLWGDGLAAVTAKKHQQMTFAAEFWVNDNNYEGDFRLLVVSMSSNPPKIDEIIEL